MDLLQTDLILSIQSLMNLITIPLCLDTYNGSCNNRDSLFDKICVTDKTEDITNSSGHRWV